MIEYTELAEIIRHFDVVGTPVSIEANTDGLIHTTLFSTTTMDGATHRYTHQRINTSIFTNPMRLMENIERITSHIRASLERSGIEPASRVLEPVRTTNGSLLHRDSSGGYWRTYRYIDGVRTYTTVSTASQAFQLGRGIGIFQNQLADFDESTLYPTIPHFHDMRVRYRHLDEAVAENRAGRVREVERELSYLTAHRSCGYQLTDALSDGNLPLRVTHNDAKISNVLFAQESGEPHCIIDLDTVMEGTVLFDVGDMIRTATNTAAEDEIDLEAVGCNIEFLAALLQGYRQEATFLTHEEEALLIESGRSITQIMAVRFLTDYLNGDRYYRTERDGQNLDRARVQIRLMEEMDSRWDSLIATLNT